MKKLRMQYCSLCKKRERKRKGMRKKPKLNKDERFPCKFAPNILTKNYKLLQTIQQLYTYKWQDVKTFHYRIAKIPYY